MVAVPIYIAMNSVERFLSTLFPAFIICRVFDYGHSDRCEVIPNCGFDLHFSNGLLAIYVSLGKCLFRSSAHF